MNNRGLYKSPPTGSAGVPAGIRSEAPELFLRRIKEEFPEIAWNTHRYLTHGWDHAVLVLDEALVFRAPKAPTSLNDVENEARLLRHLERKLEVGIPRYIYQAADGSFGGYRLLPGRELDPDTFRKLSEEERETIAGQLAAFLTSLHETPKSVARRRHVPEEDAAKDYEDLVRDTEALVFPRLARPEALAIETFLAELAAELEQDRPTALLHGDLSGEHILWDAGKRQVNIIDFSDRMLGDPAIDFAGLLAYGRGFAERVLEEYGGPTDERMFQRVRLCFKRNALETMVHSLQGYPCTFEEGYAEFEERFDG